MWLDHHDPKVTMIYAHLRPQDGDIDKVYRRASAIFEDSDFVWLCRVYGQPIGPGLMLV